MIIPAGPCRAEPRRRPANHDRELPWLQLMTQARTRHAPFGDRASSQLAAPLAYLLPSGCAAALIEIRPSRTSPRSRDPSHTAVTGAPATRQETLAPRRPLQLRSSVEASGTSRPKTKSQEDVTIFRHVHLLGPGTFARPPRPGAQRYLAADSTLVSASFVVSIARISCPRFLSPRPVPYHQ